MKNKTTTVPSDRSELSVLRQICNLIPNHLVPTLARQTGVTPLARTYSPHSHVVTMLFSQLTHAVSLNDVCDSLQLHSGPLSAGERGSGDKKEMDVITWTTSKG